jgi:hypothetical protein
MIAEAASPCLDFQVVVLRICGKRLYVADRVGGTGTLYSVTTTDPDELHTVLREACAGGCGG